MRVLMVGPSKLIILQRQMQWALDSGIEIMAADLGRHNDFRLPPGIEQYNIWPKGAHHFSKLGRRRKSARAVLIGALRLRAIARRFKPDVIHSYALSYYTDMCIKAGLSPLIVTGSGFMNNWLTKPTREDHDWLRRLQANAHTLLVQNANLLQILAERPHAPLRLELAPLGVDGNLFHPGYRDAAAGWRFALDIPDEATVLLSPRGWSKTYGQDYIMRAFATAYHQLNKLLVLVLVGLGRSKYYRQLGQEVHDLGVELGVGHALRWIPQVLHQDMPAIFALADIVINYPLHDAFATTLLEAAACERPVITCSLPAYRGTFAERYFRLVEPKSSTALADAIIEMVTNGTDVWRVNAPEARRIAVTEYAESDQRQKLLALYQQIAAESKRRT